MREPANPLALAEALTARTQQLCIGLEHGIADLYDLVTPVTAELLRWWFGEDACQSRAFNFHPGQRQAILNVIVAHEVLASPNLADLYKQVCAEALLEGTRLAEVTQGKHAHPKYCLKMATGTGKTWVLQALLIWQLLNKTAALDEGRDDPRFTRRFLIVAPGLIVYERLLDAFLGKEREDKSRDFASSDIASYADLFMPPARRERIQQFVRGNFCIKQDIGLKATGNGMIAVANWHLLSEVEEEQEAIEAEDAIDAPALVADADVVARMVLPLAPGRATGNSLDMLDRRWTRGNVLSFLAELPDLLVFNDEAHHIHELKKEGESSEVEWQKSLSRIAEGKGRRFVQVDFSATPYNDIGTGKKKGKLYFPHIVVDFDLKTAMRMGLVKSLVLDRRKELGALPLEFKAERDDDGNINLSEGQRVMLRAGLSKLRKLEADFARIDPGRHPKLLVVCEDTKVSPLVARFLVDEGLHEDDVLTVDSGRKAELGEKEWAPLRQKLFNIDKHAQPRAIVSVLMLREGFDVNNICVIVPLRASGAQILLEQTIGRGLRLMWREPEYADLKRENRERINHGEEPGSLIDILSIVEHPAFQGFYDDLMAEGLVGITGDDDDTTATGDLLAAELREGYERFDFAIPFILREADENVDHLPIEIASLLPFAAMRRSELQSLLGKGDTFTSQDLQSSTLFGDYRVDGAVMNVSGYNELLSRLTRRIGQGLNEPLPRGNRIAEHLATPYLQINTVQLATALDDYIRERLFAEAFEPFDEEGWKLLLLQPVVDHIVKVFGLALVKSEDRVVVGETEVRHRRLSEVSKLMVRESSSLEVGKCIYTRLAYPSRSGGLEKAFIEWAQADSGIEAFCKISENRHDFARMRYVKDDGLPAFYFPDFMARTADAIYMAETKAQQQVAHPNVQRKLKAAATWCERINALPAELRGERNWHYALVGESLFEDWRQKGARLGELLAFARVRPALRADAQGDLGL
ncbi:DEAD/DEAH box helicase family protein [Cognatiluteimonas profundi]|uniref:DEAD/DEAH box helicase family protein n=1 Tax=Cognatiluteimonas profundi TaxID=2594501 RepID=UPI00131DE00E|nr:DEAD/DEAH box helicase family protein [Lysobacter profundi]